MSQPNQDSNQNQHEIIKGILVNNQKPTISKGKRVSWGNARIKEFVNRDALQEQTQLNNIEEESSSNSSMANRDSTTSRVSFQNVSIGNPSAEMNNVSSSSELQKNFGNNRLTLHNLQSVIEDNTLLNKSTKNSRVTIANLNSVIDDSTLIDQTTKENTKKNRVTIANLNSVIDDSTLIDQNTKENTRKNRQTFQNLKSVIDDSTLVNENIPDMTYDENIVGEEEIVDINQIQNNRRITLSLQDKFKDVFSNNFITPIPEEKETKEQPKPVSILKKPQRGSISGHSVAFSNTSTPKISIAMSPVSSNKLILSDKRLNISDIYNDEQPKNNRITMMNPMDIFNTNSNTKKHQKIASNEILESPLPKIRHSLRSLSLNEKETVDERIANLQKSLEEKNKEKIKLIKELENEIKITDEKARRIQEESIKLDKEKQKVLNEIEANTKKIEEAKKHLFENDMMRKVLGVTIMSHGSDSEGKYSFDMIYLYKAKISFVISNTMFTQDVDIPLYSVKGELIDSPYNAYHSYNEFDRKLLQGIFDYYICKTMPTKTYTIFDLRLGIKQLIKLSASLLYLMKMLEPIAFAQITCGMRFEKEKDSLATLLTLVNPKGFVVNLLFNINILCSFNGITLIDQECLNYSMENNTFQTNKLHVDELITQLKIFLKKSINSRSACKDFFLNLYETIANL